MLLISYENVISNGLCKLYFTVLKHVIYYCFLLHSKIPYSQDIPNPNDPSITHILPSALYSPVMATLKVQ